MAEIAITVVAKVAEYSVAPIVRSFIYLWKYKSNVENLKKEVEKLEARRDSVHCLVKVGEEPLPHVKNWQDRVNQIIVEASEVAEDNPEQANMQCCKGLTCPNLKKRYLHSKKAAGRLKDVVGLEHEAVGFKQVSYSPIPEQTCLQPSKGYAAFESRTSILKDIIDALSNSDVNIVGIYGMGGVGKTTLAKAVAREAKQEMLFNKILFVEVSESSDIKNIQGVIAENLGVHFIEETVSGRANRLCDILKKEEKILVILDNIWGRIDFEKVGIPSENNPKGLKLLLTTRSSNVLTNEMDSQCNFHIEALNEEDAWSLFKSITGTYVEQQPHLKSIAPEVAKECGGMPVAIVTIARALKNKEEYQWRKALAELRNPSSKSFGGIAKEVYTSIQLSYDYLENEELKEMFLLCSRMGRTHDASIRDLFRYGFGLGMFDRFNNMEEALCSVYTSVSQLKDTSLLLDAPDNEKFSRYGFSLGGSPKNERFAIHDVVCAVARSIASRDRHVFTVIDDHVIPRPLSNENTLRNCTSFTLHNIGNLPNELELVCPKLKFLYVKLKNSYWRIPDNFFTGMLGLQVLHLVEIDLHPLSTSLSYLVNLQALCLDKCKLGDIVVIGDMRKLEILSFHGCDIEKLPKEMCQLIKLRLLDLSDCSKLSVISPNVMSSLIELEALYMGKTCIAWEVERPNTERSNVSIDELKHLCRLTIFEMHIPDPKMFKGLISSEPKRYKIFLGNYWSEWHWDLLYKTSRMLKLNLDTKEDWIISQLEGVEELHLQEVVGVRNLLDDLDRNGFPKLKHLEVSRNSHCLCIVNSVSCDVLPSLESLIVGDLGLRHYTGCMTKLEKICNSPLGAESFLRLKTIQVGRCHELNNIFSFFSNIVTVLPKLEKVEVFRCEKLEGIFAIEEQDDGNSTNEVVHDNDIKFSQLRYLNLIDLRKLKSFCYKAKTASPLQFTSDTTDSEIISEEELDGPSSLFNEKVVTPNLQVLKLDTIHVEKIWHNLVPTMSSCVQNLTKLVVGGCRNLKELFSSSMVVSKDQSRGKKRWDTISFPKLNCLHMMGLTKLTRLCSGYYIEFPSLKEFMIQSCLELEEFIFDEKVKVPSLEEMKISYMDNLKIIWHNKQAEDSFSKLKSLEVSDCQKLLKVFPSNMFERCLSLESLNVSECGSLEEICDLQGINSEKYDVCFVNLQKLQVSGCTSLKYFFAASVVAKEVSVNFVFANLTSFKLYQLPKLRRFYPGKHRVEGPALKKLELCDCTDIHDTDEECQMQPLFLVQKAFPCLEELILAGKEIMMLWKGQVPECLFHKLKTLEIQKDESVVLPFGIIQRFQNLEKLSLARSSYKEIFLYGEDQTQAATLAPLKTLVLDYLGDLKYMWEQDSRLDLILQNLEVLVVMECSTLINLMPPSASFQNLTNLDVSNCDSLENIVTSSVAKSLVKLTKMSIFRCPRMTQVVGNGGDVTLEKIIFSNLKSLSLRELNNLTSFCSWNFTLELPALEELYVLCCSNMRTFSQGDLIVPRLQKTTIKGESIRLCQDNDLNSAIRQFHEKKRTH